MLLHTKVWEKTQSRQTDGSAGQWLQSYTQRHEVAGGTPQPGHFEPHLISTDWNHNKHICYNKK